MPAKNNRAPRTNKRVKIPERMDELNKQLKERTAHIEVGSDGKYKRIDCRKVYHLAFMGMSDKELCEHFDVDIVMWRRWLDMEGKHHKPELAEALYRGREGAVSDVSHALLRRARGYRHKKKVYMVNGKGQIVEKETIVQYPPDFASASFILKNKRPQSWKDKPSPEDQDGHKVIQPVINVITSQEAIDKLTKLKDAAKNTKPKKS